MLEMILKNKDTYKKAGQIYEYVTCTTELCRETIDSSQILYKHLEGKDSDYRNAIKQFFKKKLKTQLKALLEDLMLIKRFLIMNHNLGWIENRVLKDKVQ